MAERLIPGEMEQREPQIPILQHTSKFPAAISGRSIFALLSHTQRTDEEGNIIPVSMFNGERAAFLLFASFFFVSLYSSFAVIGVGVLVPRFVSLEKAELVMKYGSILAWYGLFAAAGMLIFWELFAGATCSSYAAVVLVGLLIAHCCICSQRRTLVIVYALVAVVGALISWKFSA